VRNEVNIITSTPVTHNIILLPSGRWTARVTRAEETKCEHNAEGYVVTFKTDKAVR